MLKLCYKTKSISWQGVGLIQCHSMLFTCGLASEPLEKALTSAKADLWGFECSSIMKPFLLCLQHLILASRLTGIRIVGSGKEAYNAFKRNMFRVAMFRLKHV